MLKIQTTLKQVDNNYIFSKFIQKFADRLLQKSVNNIQRNLKDENQ